MGELVPVKDKVNTIRGLLEERREQIAMALPRHLTPDRLIRVALNATIRTPKLLDCTQASLVGAIIECATLGLEPDCLGQAWIIPYGQNATLIVGYKGLLDLARRSGEISTIQAVVVRDKDDFAYEMGLDPKLVHRPYTEEDGGELRAVYAIARLKDGGVQWEVMQRWEIEKIRKAAPSAKRSSPWDTHYEEMAKKTVLRRLCKLLPSSIELKRAVELDEAAEVGLPQRFEGAITIPEEEPADPEQAATDAGPGGHIRGVDFALKSGDDD